MIFDFDPYELWKKGLCIFSLIFFSFIALHFFTNIIKSSKDSICDSEKQSKFILECLNSDTTKQLRAISACEEMSIRLYCK
jgi:hypothetical protein